MRLKLLAAGLTAAVFAAHAGPATAAAAPLAETYARYAQKLAASPLKRPLVIESSESKNSVAGEVYALLSDPFEEVAQSLADASSWCALMILHPNVAQCRPATGGNALDLAFARRFDQAEDDAVRAQLSLKLQRTDGQLTVRLEGDEGPLGTGDFRFHLEGIPVEGNRTFVRLSYSCSYGFVARTATQAYLSGKGKDKVGFTVVGNGKDGPQYIGGLRGAVERNVMRYHLAVESWLAARTAPPAERFGRALNGWLDAIEAYPRQLREEDRVSYAKAKQEARKKQ